MPCMWKAVKINDHNHTSDKKKKIKTKVLKYKIKTFPKWYNGPFARKSLINMEACHKTQSADIYSRIHKHVKTGTLPHVLLKHEKTT